MWGFGFAFKLLKYSAYFARIYLMNKDKIVWVIILAVGIAFFGVYVWTSDVRRTSDVVDTPSESPDSTSSPQAEPSATESPSATPAPSKSPNVTKIPLPTGDAKTTFVGEPVPWSLLLSDASCELKGEIKFLNGNTYDNQDAVFIYSGIDHPGRNIKWTIAPDEANLFVGPNIFSKIQIPYGQALLGVFLSQEPKSKRYELTAKIQYGRLVDEKGKFVIAGGNVKLFEKQCVGKTTVVFP